MTPLDIKEKLPQSTTCDLHKLMNTVFWVREGYYTFIIVFTFGSRKLYLLQVCIHLVVCVYTSGLVNWVNNGFNRYYKKTTPRSISYSYYIH